MSLPLVLCIYSVKENKANNKNKQRSPITKQTLLKITTTKNRYNLFTAHK